MKKFKLDFKLFYISKIILIYFFISLKCFAESAKISDNLIVLGINEAPIKIKVFSSLTCPHCASFHLNVLPEIKKRYVDSGKVQLIFIDFPLDKAAFHASILLNCADRGKQISLLDDIYKSQSEWTTGSSFEEINNNLKKVVKIFGINSKEFEKCLNNETISDKILIGRLDGEKKYSISSTPTIVINEEKFTGTASLENIIKKIEKLI
tara:strand:- start:9433 stop:10056 length:624 start_codon:yes stop_codon:yes gene_type:complete